MSAIWGVVTLDGKEEIPENAKDIFETIYQKKCKIDRYESRTAFGAYFGCGIQYITEEAKREELPIVDKERGFLFTADCILDNRKEIIELLVTTYGYEKQLLKESPDGKLMYYAYCCMGREAVKKFRGLFAIAVWNEKERSLTLISDQVSSRCLYYIRRGNLLAFSTLMEPLIQFSLKKEQNLDYYKDFLLVNPSVIYVVPGETPYREISLMLPATELRITAQDEKKDTYWMLGDNTWHASEGKKSCESPEEIGKNFLELYENCVKDALRTSGEVGIAMSSGLDSSSIGVLAARELEKSGKTLYSYTFAPNIAMEHAIVGNNVYNETGLVKEIAQMYPNMKTTFLNNQDKNIFADMNFCMKLLEMPYKTGTFPNHYEMCREGAGMGCKVFLNGGFGNNTVSFGEIDHVLHHLYKKKSFGKLFLYWNRYARHEKISRFKMLYRLFKHFYAFDKNGGKELEHFVPKNYFLMPSILKDYDLKKRFSQDKRIVVSDGYIDKDKYEEHLRATGLLIYLGVFETKFGLDTGMLLRDPTKDVRLISFCYQLPYHFFAYKGKTRWLIRNQFKELLPKTVLDKWQQRGLLNVDWVNRIYRDWNEIKPELIHDVSLDLLDEWIDRKHIMRAIENFGKDQKKDQYVITYLCAIDALCRFIRIQG